MQPGPSHVDIESEALDLQNDPYLQELFHGAIEFLHLVGADRNEPDANRRLEVHQPGSQQRLRRKEEEHKKKGYQVVRIPEISSSERRKLERIKAPVTVFRKTKQIEGPSEGEQEITVQKTLSYVQQMPAQEEFQPPPVPVVSFTNKDNNQVLQSGENTAEDAEETNRIIPDYTYLSNEKDIALWKMLLGSPTNCNIFVGGLDHGVTSGMLQGAFETFCIEEEEKSKLKAHVVMDAFKHQSKGYGFVTFPCRRSAEMAMICMQEFEIHGKALQLGWGQENRESKLLKAENLLKVDSPRSDQTVQQTCEQEMQVLGISTSTQGSVVSDTVHSGEENPATKQPLKRRPSRWDQETPEKFQRLENPQDLDNTPANTDKDNKERRSSLEVFRPVTGNVKQQDQKDLDLLPRKQVINPQETLSLNREEPVQKGRFTVLLSSEEANNCRTKTQSAINSAFEDRQNVSVDSGVDSTVFREKESDLIEPQGQSVDVAVGTSEGVHVALKGLSISGDAVGVDRRMCSTETQHCPLEKTRSEHRSRRTVQWLTHDQKISLLKSVCSKLRVSGVRGHLGVFGVYYEADNSRLYVVCAKHVTELQLQHVFSIFGVADVKLNKDINGFSKGCAHIQFSDSKCAETAIKQLHGKLVGGLPMKVMVAEPKLRKGTRRKNTAPQIDAQSTHVIPGSTTT